MVRDRAGVIAVIGSGLALLAAGCTPAPVTIVNNQTSATQTPNGTPLVARAANANGNLTLARAAVSGIKQKIDSYFALNGDCSSAGFPVAIIKSAPSHGTFVAAQGEDFSNFQKDAPRANCNAKASPAIVAYYTSAAGYTGADSVTVDVIWPGGGARLIEYHMTVEGN